MKGYKAFNKDLTCRDMRYEIGKTYEMDAKPIACEIGFHFCKNLEDVYDYYKKSDDTRICEVVALGEINTDDNIKFCTNRIRIVREIKSKSIKHCNVDKSEIGYFNSGNRNSGNFNSGFYNSGDWNSGNRNSGNFNSGNRNSGNFNSGDRNSGDWNSGDRNSGNHNSGFYNSCDYNSGDHNSGFYNSGDWNSGNFNAGCFNTNIEQKINMFDKPTDWTMSDWKMSRANHILEGCPASYSGFIRESEMSDEEKEYHPEYKAMGGYVKCIKATKADKQKWWDDLSDEDKEACFALPNFDADKFCKCVGIMHI